MRKRSRTPYDEAEHVLGIASTARGAGIAYIGRSGAVRASVLDRWAACQPVLLFARDEAREIQRRESELGAYLHGLLVRDFGAFPEVRIFENVIHPWTDWLLRDLDVRPHDIDLVVTSNGHFATCENRLGSRLGCWFPRARIAVGIRHHEIHQRQAFWSSGLPEAAVLTLDESGGTLSRFTQTGGSKLLRDFPAADSNPGPVFDALRSQLGLKPGEHEELTRMASEGKSGPAGMLDEGQPAAALAAYLAEGEARGELETRRRNGARAALDLLTAMLEPLFRRALDLAGCQDLCFGGNLALYPAAAEAACARVKPRALHLPPHPGEQGQALGCALYGAYELAGWPPPATALSQYLGPAYCAQEALDAARESGAHVVAAGRPEQAIADLIANGNATARFAGRAAFCTEGRGGRSVLIDPRRNDAARLFPGSLVLAVLEEEAREWFEDAGASGQHARIATPRARARETIPAAAGHAVQIRTVRVQDDQCYHRLLEAWRRGAGLPCVFEAPLRLPDGPLAETPCDAVECFRESSAIDCLALESFVLTRRDASAR